MRHLQRPGQVYGRGCANIPAGDCDCGGNQLDVLSVCGGDCVADADGDGVCDVGDDCVGQYDACSICNGPGQVYECGCANIPAGDCGWVGTNWTLWALQGRLRGRCRWGWGLRRRRRLCRSIRRLRHATDLDRSTRRVCQHSSRRLRLWWEPTRCPRRLRRRLRPMRMATASTTSSTIAWDSTACGIATDQGRSTSAVPNIPAATAIATGTSSTSWRLRWRLRRNADGDGVCDVEDDCVGQYDACGICNGRAVYECGCAIPAGDCDCDGNQLDVLGVCGGDCVPMRMAMAFDVDDDPAGQYDACGICNGPDRSTVRCANIPAGDCDCDGNQSTCSASVEGLRGRCDGDGVCDVVDDCVGQYDACGICNGLDRSEWCANIPAEDCDCDGNEADAVGMRRHVHRVERNGLRRRRRVHLSHGHQLHQRRASTTDLASSP